MRRFAPSSPGRGDVVLVRMRGSEPRPALVLSPAAYSAVTGRVLVCPVAPSSRGYPFEVALPSRPLEGSVVLADRITSIDVRGCEHIVCRVPAGTVRSVQEHVLPLLVVNAHRILTASEGAAVPEGMETRPGRPRSERPRSGDPGPRPGRPWSRDPRPLRGGRPDSM